MPAVVVVPGGVPACESRGCSGDPAPPHDLVTGNIGLIAALEAIAAEGEAGREDREGASGTHDGRRTMTARRIFRGARAPLAARLFGWTLLAAVCGFLLWIVFGGGAQAGDPKAAARAIGNAGAATAGAIARDAAKAATVPGYAGTNLPERNIGADALETEGQARLADPDDPGGQAGRSVVEGATTRPTVPVTVSDPGVARGKAVAADPQAPAHGADNLASGAVSDCGAGLPEADRGGACGSVRWCVGADCGSTEAQANTGFVEATTRLNMAVEMGGEEFDRDSLRIFTGRKRACHIHFGGLANCCKNSGALVGLANCSASERELAEERNAGNTHYLGKYCSKRVFGVCIRRSRAWCVFSSKLGRILHQQARPQLGIGWGSCRGFTVAEIERIDFGALDLSEFADNLMDGSTRARRVAARRRRHADAHEGPGARLLRAATVMVRPDDIRPPACPGTVFAAWRCSASGRCWVRPTATGEWRSWCGAAASAGISTATGRRNDNRILQRHRERPHRPLSATRNPRPIASRRCARRSKRRAPKRSSIRRRRR